MPHSRPQEEHCDLGLDPDADRTEDLRPAKSNDLRAATPRSSTPTPTRNEIGNQMMTHHDDVDIAWELTLINERLRGVPVPAGATAGDWSAIRDADRDAVRFLKWHEFRCGELTVTVDGWQNEDGHVSRGITVHGLEQGGQLTAGVARNLAEALIKAADGLDRVQ